MEFAVIFEQPDLSFITFSLPLFVGIHVITEFSKSICFKVASVLGRVVSIITVAVPLHPIPLWVGIITVVNTVNSVFLRNRFLP
jgi:hypothetical protein